MLKRMVLYLLTSAVALMATVPFMELKDGAASQRAVSAPSAIQTLSNDALSERIVMFYKAILQEANPTTDQETDLFVKDSGLRANLLAWKRFGDDGPVVLMLFRQHRDLFLPRGMKSLADVNISGGFTFVRTLEKKKDENRSDGHVMALFVQVRDAHPARLRTVIFDIDMKTGKIDPDGIDIGGFDGTSTYELFFDPNVPVPTSGPVTGPSYKSSK